MLQKHRTVHWTETYRFSATRTISDYPLVIGEILCRSELARRQTRRKKILYEIRRAFGLPGGSAVSRVRLAIPSRGNGYREWRAGLKIVR
jgi:hypothetical protein